MNKNNLLFNLSSKFDKFVTIPILKSIGDFPNNNAFNINEVIYTYKQFGEYISKIRVSIKKLNETYFGLVVNDDIETYASIFALWLEGKAYIPLHPKHPLERNEEIIAQMSIQIMLDSTKKSLYGNYKVIETSRLVFQESFLEIDKEYGEETTAYILFTSGSTGKPKGVMINRKNLGVFMDSFWDTGIQIDENDRCLQTFDLTFDVSVQSFLTPLTKGACVYTIPHDQIKYSYVFGLLEDHELTFGALAPSMLRYLKPYFEEIDLPKMKACIVTAEASPIDLIEEWQKCIPNATIYDFYGPTEATIYCTYYEVEKNNSNKVLNGMLSIGKPLKNVDAIIIDEDNHIQDKGEKGELCVAGDQVTQGYWKDPEKNEQSFFYMNFNGINRRFYHTGDLCFLDEDDNLMLFGRKDSQVKIQGYRIELGEIEYHIRRFLKRINVVVLPFNNKSNNTELAIILESKEINTISLLEHLKLKVPTYMIPTKTVFEPKFPLNSSDKVDKVKLKLLLK